MSLFTGWRKSAPRGTLQSVQHAFMDLHAEIFIQIQYFYKKLQKPIMWSDMEWEKYDMIWQILANSILYGCGVWY